jgi:hypothetical protein
MASRHRQQLKERQIRYVTMCLTGMPEHLKTDRARAIACGWSEAVADCVGDQEEVKRLFAEIGEELRQRAVKRIVDGVEAQVADRNAALKRLWEIANMPKEDAGNTMHAQTNACIRYIEFVSGPGETNGKTKEGLPRAAWMDKQAGEDKKPN